MDEHSWDAGDIGDDDDGLAYKPISRCAVAAAFLGVLSLLALAVSQMWVIVILALGFGAYAVWSISNDPIQMAGIVPAVAGLMLGLFTATFLMVHDATIDGVVDRRGRELAVSWLELMGEQKLKQAHMLKLPPTLRPPESVSLEKFYGISAEALEDYQKFVKDPLTLRLTASGAIAKIEFLQKTDQTQSKAITRLTNEFRLHYASGSSTDVLVTIIRHNPHEGVPGKWNVGFVELSKGNEL